jgi:transposase
MLRPSVPMVEQALEYVIKTLIEENQHLRQRIAHLERELAKARKNSTTLSKPPSSDLVKPPKRPHETTLGPRRIGGQPGHPKHARAAVPPGDST